LSDAKLVAQRHRLSLTDKNTNVKLAPRQKQNSQKRSRLP
jgi:hypothetical protein